MARVEGLNGGKEHAQTLGGFGVLAAAAAVGIYFITRSDMSMLAKIAASVGAAALPVLGGGYYAVSAIKDAVEDRRGI